MIDQSNRAGKSSGIVKFLDELHLGGARRTSHINNSVDVSFISNTFLSGPSGYPSPDPTMGYMMDGQHAAAAAMMQARPPGEAGYEYPHAAAAYYGQYGHL